MHLALFYMHNKKLKLPLSRELLSFSDEVLFVYSYLKKIAL